MSEETIGRYQVVKELGRGGMGRVLLAFDPSVERQVAIKVLPRQFVEHPNARARFLREAKTVAGLEHNAIVPLYDFGEDDGEPYLVMRMLPGGTLTQRIRNKGRLSVGETVNILERIGAALDFAHSQGLVHRDVKPDNVLFDQQGDAFLSDFGIVKLDESDTALTGANIIGTPAYISPEQAIGNVEVGPASDIYSLGVMAYQMLSGDLPFRADTPMQMAMRHINDPAPDITDQSAELDAALGPILRRAMAKQPENRFKNAGEFVQALRAVARGDEKLAATIVEQAMHTLEADTLQRAARTAEGAGAADQATTVKPRAGSPVPLLLLLGGGGVVALVGLALLVGVGALAFGLFGSGDDQPTPVVAVGGTPIVSNEPTLPVGSGNSGGEGDVAATAAAIVQQTAEAASLQATQTQEAIPPTPLPDTVFPLPDDVQNLTVTFAGDIKEQANYQTTSFATLEEAMDFHRDIFLPQGLTERALLSVTSETTFSMVFDGAENGRAIVVQGVDLDGSLNINIRYEDV